MLRPCSIVIAALLAVGCTENKNLRITIGDDIPLASFPPEITEPTLDQDGNPVPTPPPADDEATALGLDRSNFEPMTFRVPVDGTRHELHGIDSLTLTSETARQRGEFPTAVNALETGSWTSTSEQITEGFAQPFIVTGGLLFHSVGLLYPEWLAAHFVSGLVSSPSHLFDRAPAMPDTMNSGVIHQPIAQPDGDESHAEPSEG